ncbi:hypothetical protein HanLR1_Chr14g0556381 [Helianthus annuus]|nr:hypothetical protein HanLR1_Chr14g0556381 [Helianthus annuus]
MSLIYYYMLYFLPNFSRTMVHAKLLKPSFFKYFLSVHLGRTNGSVLSLTNSQLELRGGGGIRTFNACGVHFRMKHMVDFKPVLHM